MLQDIITPGFRSSNALAILKTTLDGLSKDAKDKLIHQVNSIFEFYVMTNEGKTETFTINLKKGSNNDNIVIKGKGAERPSAIVAIRDVDLVDLANRGHHGRPASMDSKLKAKLEVIFRQSDRRGKWAKL